MRRGLTLLFLVVLAAHAAAATKPRPKILPPVRYVCEDGTRLRVTYTPADGAPGTAILEILGTGKRLSLDQAPAADGGRYTSGSTELWDKGGTARFTQDAKTLTCRAKT